MSNKIDAMVANHLFGAYQTEWHGESGHWFVPHRDGHPDHRMFLSCVDNRLRGHNVRDRDGLPKFSENMDAAWVVRCELVARGFEVTVGSHGGLGNVTDDTCEITGDEDANERWEAGATSAPLAICLAALRAVGVPESAIQEALA